MLSDLFPTEADEELHRVTDCECCGERKSDVLYIVKMKKVIVFIHICNTCINDPYWEEAGDETQYINKV